MSSPKQPNLAKALQYIRDHARNEAVSVSDAWRARFGLSRRALENWFRREMGHSILNEIRRVRTDHIARMLVGNPTSGGPHRRPHGIPGCPAFRPVFPRGKVPESVGFTEKPIRVGWLEDADWLWREMVIHLRKLALLLLCHEA